MAPEIEAHSRQIRSLLERIVDSLVGLTEEQVNEPPPVAGANSAHVIAAHVLGNARAWVLGIACGQSVRRDRPAEFRARGTLGELKAAARDLSLEIEAALAALPAAELDRRLVPAQPLWGEGKAAEISVREALLHVIEHAAIHLGQLHLTRDLLLSAPP